MIPHFGLFQCPTAEIMSRKVEILEDVAVQMDVDYFSTQSMSIPTEDSWLDSDVSMMSSVVTCQDGRVALCESRCVFAKCQREENDKS